MWAAYVLYISRLAQGCQVGWNADKKCHFVYSLLFPRKKRHTSSLNLADPTVSSKVVAATSSTMNFTSFGVSDFLLRVSDLSLHHSVTSAFGGFSVTSMSMCQKPRNQVVFPTETWIWHESMPNWYSMNAQCIPKQPPRISVTPAWDPKALEAAPNRCVEHSMLASSWSTSLSVTMFGPFCVSKVGHHWPISQLFCLSTTARRSRMKANEKTTVTRLTLTIQEKVIKNSIQLGCKEQPCFRSCHIQCNNILHKTMMENMVMVSKIQSIGWELAKRKTLTNS